MQVWYIATYHLERRGATSICTVSIAAEEDEEPASVAERLRQTMYDMAGHGPVRMRKDTVQNISGNNKGA